MCGHAENFIYKQYHCISLSHAVNILLLIDQFLMKLMEMFSVILPQILLGY